MTKRGPAKVLDFGLAKVTQPISEPGSESQVVGQTTVTLDEHVTSPGAPVFYPGPKTIDLIFIQLDPMLGVGRKVGEVDSSHLSQWAVSPDGSLIAVTNNLAFPHQLLLRNPI